MPFERIYAGRPDGGGVFVYILRDGNRQFVEKRFVESQRHNYRSEKRALARCRGHPHIVELHDQPFNDKLLTIRLAYYDTCLADVLGTATMDQKIRWFGDIVDAVVYLHDVEGIVHRDIKVENVLIDREDGARLCDFGLSEEVESLEFSPAICGTIGVIPPEILAADPQDEKVDVWALGILLYEMLCKGKNPFLTDPFRATLGEYEEAIQRRVCSDSNLGKYRRLILACLMSKPSDRPTAKEVLKECKRLKFHSSTAFPEFLGN